jgi:signal transduction histidine kinase
MIDEKKYTILYVDDEESNLRIFRNTFRKQYNIITATSGDEALSLLENKEIDLILTDQRMPGMSGIDFLKIAIGKYPELNRILVTAYSDYDILQQAVNELKIFQYVEKPWREEDIKSTIDSALEIHRLKVENRQLTSSLIDSNQELVRINEELSDEIELHKSTQIELIRQKEFAENCNRLKSAFLANMSHEIRTPMNSIMGFLSILEDEDLPLETKKEYMGIVQKSGSQLLHIIDDIIEISKIDTGNVELKLTKFSVNPLLERLYKTMLITSKNKSIQFNLNGLLPDDCSELTADSTRLEQVMNNLLVNAFKFTSEGTVDFGAEMQGTQVLFYVKDTGIGIAKENFGMIFNRFSKVEDSIKCKYGGNGLGLAISKAYAEKMGGKIWVESELGKGSTFYFTLPL